MALFCVFGKGYHKCPLTYISPSRATPSNRPASDRFPGRRGPKSPGKVSTPRPQDTQTSLADARVTAHAAGAVGADSQVQTNSASGPAKIGSGLPRLYEFELQSVPTGEPAAGHLLLQTAQPFIEADCALPPALAAYPHCRKALL